MTKGTWDLAPGSLVVLEGIDQAGKSTQLERLKLLLPDAMFTHQPSGGNVVGQVVYELTEKVDNLHPVARQLLHLASHTEHYAREIIPALTSGAVVMDRCWWSTVAYGYFAGNLQYAFPDYKTFESLAKVPTQGIEPAVVFAFTHAWKPDRHNTDAVLSGYHSLMERYRSSVEAVPVGDEDSTTDFIIKRLNDRGLLRAIR